MTGQIRGSGGGGKSGGGGSSFYEANDSIQSIQYARVLHLLGWGKIGGLANGLKSVYLDDTPVQNTDGSFNFSNCTFITRNGTPNQDPIPGFSAAESETSISTRVRNGTPIVRRVTDATVSAARVTIGIPQLSYTDTSNNRVVGTTVQYAIDVNANGGGWVEKANVTINAKSTSRYQRSSRVELAGAGPWDVRVRRLTADSTSSTLINETWWDSMTEISDYRLSYPNMALIGVNIDAKQFSSAPTCKFLLNLREIQIPSNYDPVAHTYTGDWDGTFKTAVASNPAWCLYDMQTHTEYGLGRYIPAALQDKWALYTIGRYCDEMVPNGFGGFEPRYTLNVWINTQQSAYELLNSIVTSFRGMLFSAGGALRVVADMPDSPKMLYTNANVIDGKFEYTGTPRNQRHSVAVVKFSNPELMYQDDYEPYEDSKLIARFGVRKLDVSAFGCTSRGQAHRMAKWALYSESYDNAISFKTGLDKTSFLRPGDIVQIADTKRAGVRMGGRIAAASTSVIHLDAPVELDASGSYGISVLLPDGTMQESAIVSASGSVTSIELATPLTSVPLVGGVWVISSKNLQPMTARIISIKPSSNAKNIFEVSVLEWGADKFDYIDKDFALEPSTTSSISTVPKAVTGITASESLYEDKTTVKIRLTVSWVAPAGASYYLVRWRRDSDNWQSVTAYGSSQDIDDTQPGVYQVSVVAVNAIGRQSTPVTAGVEVYGLTKSPDPLGGLDFTAYNGLAMLSWPQSSDLDVRVGGHIRIKHSPRITGASWEGATDIGPSIPGIATQATLPLLSGTYLAKAVDSGGYESLDAVEVVTNAPSVISFNAVDALIQNPGFVGTAVGCMAIDGKLKIASSTTVDSWPSIDSIRDFDTGDDVAPQAIYYFDRISDLGTVDTARLTAAIDADIRPTVDTVDTWVSVDARQSWDGTVSGMADAIIQMSTTDGDHVSSDWSDWSPLRVGDYRARAFRFRVLMHSFDPFVAIDLLGLSVTVDMPDRIVELSDVQIQNTGQFVSFSPPFRSIPTVGITAQGLQPGEYVDFSARSKVGFFVTIRNASGVGVARSIDVMAKGWGYDAT